jgi:aminoglycoside phosphotransferase (APT) family kinase protein
MQREYRIISELSENNLKVPKPIFLCTDRTVSDDDFYIMEYIEGETIADNVVAENYSKNDKKEITNSFITTLSELHTFDVKNSKLNDLGKHEDYVLRQLNRWTKQFNAQKVRDITDLDIATKLLFDTIPTQQKVSIVHGDYRLDNVRVNNNLVAAIVDWELCTLGDPLADLGTVIASWSNKNETDTPFIYSPSLSDGFPSRQEIINLYDSKSDLDLKNVEFYVRLSFWKHAMIMEGVYVRYSLGYYGNVDKKDVEAFGKSTLSFAKKASNKNLLKEIF